MRINCFLYSSSLSNVLLWKKQPSSRL